MSLELALKLNTLGTPRILVVGDLIADWDINGHFRDTPAQEDETCQVFVEEEVHCRNGGAGAVLDMVKGLGGRATSLMAFTAKKHRWFVNGRQVFRSDSAYPNPPDQLADLHDCLNDADCVLIADYGRGTCTDAVLRAAIDGAKERGIPCIVDPAHGADWRRYKRATCIKCNWPEWESIVGSGKPIFDDPSDVPYTMIATQGEDGMALLNDKTFPARKRQVVDVTGAGDMVLAVLGVCIAGGLGWPDACKIANAAAGLKVERHGAVPVQRCEVVADLLHGCTQIPVELLTPVAEAAHWQLKKVVFTNGCFDLLHPAHCRMLAEAKAQGDVLIVAVNDDESVREQKGQFRPVRKCEDRCEQVAALGCVDWVVSFNSESELSAIIEAVRPDVLCKGAQWDGLKLTGEQFAGRVHFCEQHPGHSTTKTLNYIKAGPA